MRLNNRLLTTCAFVCAVGAPSICWGALPNVAYSAQEVGTSIDQFNVSTDGPPGVDAVMMVHGYLIVLGTKDSGAPTAVWHTYDITNPRDPKLMATHGGTAITQIQREMHVATMSKVGGKDIFVAPTTKGIAFFDLTDVMKIGDVSALALTGVSGGDYTNVAWHSSYSWPYVFTGSSGSGVNVTDAHDPANPTLLTTIPISKIGNFRVGPVYAAGNYLVVTNMDESPFRVSVIDVSDPKNPVLRATGSAPNGHYSTLVIGDLIVGGGFNANYNFLKWTPDSVKVLNSQKIGTDKGGYCSYQDTFAFCGQSSDGVHKIDLSNEMNPKLVWTGHLGAFANGGDFDFAIVLGNLVYNGNDHPTGSGLIPHQMAPDTTPPKVLKVYPEANAIKQPLSTRITIFFTDEVDTDTITDANVVIQKSGGAVVDGVFSHSSVNAVSFGPKQPLEPNSTYTITVVPGGIKDVAGNAITEMGASSFSTGDTVVVGAGGAGGSGGGGNGGGGSGGGTAGAAIGGGGSASGANAGQTNGAGGVGVLGGSPGASGGASGAAVAGGPQAPATDNSAGCGCRMPGQRSSGNAILPLSVIAFGVGFSRARRRLTKR